MTLVRHYCNREMSVYIIYVLNMNPTTLITTDLNVEVVRKGTQVMVERSAQWLSENKSILNKNKTETIYFFL